MKCLVSVDVARRGRGDYLMAKGQPTDEKLLIPLRRPKLHKYNIHVVAACIETGGDFWGVFAPRMAGSHCRAELSQNCSKCLRCVHACKFTHSWECEGGRSTCTNSQIHKFTIS